jgi:hypothetical protein
LESAKKKARRSVFCKSYAMILSLEKVSSCLHNTIMRDQAQTDYSEVYGRINREFEKFIANVFRWCSHFPGRLRSAVLPPT